MSIEGNRIKSARIWWKRSSSNAKSTLPDVTKSVASDTSLLMTPENLGHGLPIEVVMKELHVANLLDRLAPIAPTRQRRDEIVGRSQLHVNLKPFFYGGDKLEDAQGLGIELHIDVDGLVAEAEQKCGGLARQADPPWDSGLIDPCRS